MNLVVDIGNTSIKLAIYGPQGKIAIRKFDILDEAAFDNFLKEYDTEKVIVSSVRKVPEKFSEYFKKRAKFFHFLSSQSKLPFPVDYETPETLGTDRIAAVAGAYKAFQNKNCLIIDAGSAITYDFMIYGRFIGGNISPGISMRFRALNTFTDALPLVKEWDEFSFPGVNTTDAIAAGVISGVIYEINEYIRTFEKKYKNTVIILTGGDGKFLNSKIIDKPVYMPDLVIDGLNFILEYNV